MDFLEENFGATTTPVDLTQLVGTEVPPTFAPTGAIRNRAAITSLLSGDPEKAVDSYQLLLKESEEGQSSMFDAMQKSVATNTSNLDMKGVMSILGDTNIPLEGKKRAIEALKNSMILKDSGIVLHSNSLSAPSRGENPNQENSRLSSSEAIKEIYEARTGMQGLVNAHAASLDPVSASTFAGMVAMVAAPFGNAVNTGMLKQRIAEAEGKKLSTWEIVKGFIAPGSTVMNTREKLAQLPPSERVKYTQNVLEGIRSNKNIIFGNDNQFAEFQRATNIFEEGGYSSVDVWLDNLANVLDVVGLGALARAKKVVPAAKPSDFVQPPNPSSQLSYTRDRKYTSEGAPWEVATTGGKPTAGAYDSKIADLEKKREDLLGDAGNLLDKGEVSSLNAELKTIPKPRTVNEVAKEIQAREGITSKAAKEEAAKLVADQTADYNGKVARIKSELERNAKSATVSQKIDAIDKQIAELSKNNTPIFAKKNPIADAIERMDLNHPVHVYNPAAPAIVVQHANPDIARNMHKAVFDSVGDYVAMALYGTTRTQAIVTDTFPQVSTMSGVVTSKVTDIQRNLSAVSEEITNMGSATGATFYTDTEKLSAKANVVRDFKSVEGLIPNDAMSSFNLDGGRINISAVYGSTEGGFTRVEEAVKATLFGLRKHGVMDSELEVLRKEGLDYVPTTITESAGKDGSYFVRVKTFHDIDPTDITAFSKLDVKRNIFDSIAPFVSQTAGSVSRYMFDAASMLHPTITGAASNVTDATAKFDKFMLELASNYSDIYVNLAKDRKLKVDQYIREANYNGIKMEVSDLVARGFQAREIQALQEWKKFWDGHFYLENADVIKTLNSQGFELFENATTALYAKPIRKNTKIGWFYDPAVDDVVREGVGEADVLYAAGGTYAKLRKPITVNGIEVEHMIVRNTSTEYTRKFRDTDRVLNYRDGYFQIQYKSPKFIEETAVGGKAKAIAVAGDTKEAKFFAEQMQKANPNNSYNVRGDVRELQRGSDEWWDLNTASGRIAQRRRGKLLEDASGLNHLGDGEYILDPVESAVRAAKSIAGRTVARPMLEAAKARFLDQYQDVLVKNQYGGYEWPKNVGEIVEKGKETSKRSADARTTYEYINYLENGYINSIDNGSKWVFNKLANIAGEMGMAKTERGLMWVSEVAPTSVGKNAVFMAYIGTNVLRQWIVQPHQIVRTFSYNPIGWVNGGIEKLSAEYIGDLMGVNKSGNRDFINFVNNSGLMDAVDKSNLVRGTLLEAAHNSGNPAYRAGKFVTDTTRKAGFDLGERANLLGHIAAVYERRKRLGVNLNDKALRDEAYSEIRAISYDMNFAGDMPYNQTTPSLVLQFMQVPHKALLQMTNRRIAPMDRLRMASGDLLLWGGPTVLVSKMLGADILPDNPFLKETFLWGLESALMNNMFNVLAGTKDADERDKINIDFGSLAPYELSGWTKFFEAMYSGGMSDMVTNSPAGQLFLKDGGRVRNAIASVMRAFNIVEDIDEDGDTFTSTMHDVLKISSGWNNAYKAKLLLDAGVRLDQYGNTIDKTVHNVEAYMQALGFTTADTRDLYRLSMTWSKDVKGHREEVIKVYNDIKRYYAERLEVENTDPVFITKVSGKLLKVFEYDPAAMSIIHQEWSRDMQGKDKKLMDLFLKRAQIKSTGNLRDEVQQMPVDDGQKKLMLQHIDDLEKARLPYEND